MATPQKPLINEAEAEGTTLWLTIFKRNASDREVLAQALFDALAQQVRGVDEVWIESNGNITITAEEDIQLTPGGDDAFARLISDMDSPRGADAFFMAEPSIGVGFDLGLLEVRIA